MKKRLFRYVLPEKKKRMHLVVSPGVHTLVLLYAKRRGITMSEATFQLLRIAFCEVHDLPQQDLP
jgi:hypothetical protein